jgi:S-formylglutathione hydrolase
MVFGKRSDIIPTQFSAQKGTFLSDASAQGIAILFPDTSPRGAGIEGEDADWDFGTGAGFYLNATNTKYSKHYNMATYVTLELPQVIEAAGIPIVHFPPRLASFRCADIFGN